MCRYVGLWLGLLLRCFQSRRSLFLENLALRQQLVVLKRKHPRPRIGAVDKIFWLLARRFWSNWKQSLVLVNPETVVRWHRAGFRLYWSLISRGRRRGRGASGDSRSAADTEAVGCGTTSAEDAGGPCSTRVRVSWLQDQARTATATASSQDP